MARSWMYCALLMAVSGGMLAGEPAVAPVSGRKQIETKLQTPAKLDFEGRTAVSVAEVLERLHRQHGLSLRFDAPTLSAAYGMEAISTVRRTPGEQHSARLLDEPGCTWSDGAAPKCEQKLAPVGKPGSVADDRVAQYAVPAAGVSGIPLDVPAVRPVQATSPVTPSTTGPVQPPPLVQLPEPLPPIAAPADPGHSVPPGGKLIPVPAPLPEKPAADQDEATPAFMELMAQIQVDIRTVKTKDVSIATLLKHTLDAMPNTLQEAGLGLPIVLTAAGQLDYLVEDDGLLITSRMKAVTYKETRVYSLKQIGDCTPEQVATTIKQSIRPWSWRSRINDLGDQLKVGGLPSDLFGTIVKTSVQMVGNDANIAIGIPEVVREDAPSKNAPATGADAAFEAKQAAMLGNTVVNGLVTLAHASLTAIEIAHYADPPTGTIQVLPTKLVITQSQAAHREIAELLTQLADE